MTDAQTAVALALAVVVVPGVPFYLLWYLTQPSDAQKVRR